MSINLANVNRSSYFCTSETGNKFLTKWSLLLIYYFNSVLLRTSSKRLPSEIQSSPSLTLFRQRLKTYLFQKSFPDVLLWWLRLRGPRNNICYSGHVKYFSDWLIDWLVCKLKQPKNKNSVTPMISGNKVKVKLRGFIQRLRWQASRPQGAQTWITQINLQTTPCLPLAFVRVHQMAPPRTVVTISSCSLLLIYRPRKDERLSWPS